MKISQTGLAIVKAFEGCHKAIKGKPGYFIAYRDPVGVLTCGYGHTNHHPPRITGDTVWSQEACDAVLADDMIVFEKHVESLARVPLKQHEFDALVSWAFNTGGPSHASLWKKLRARQNEAIPDELRKWNKAGGKALAGLTRRRSAEAVLFMGDTQRALAIAGVRGKPPAARATPPPPDIPKMGPKIPTPGTQPGTIQIMLGYILSIFRRK